MTNSEIASRLAISAADVRKLTKTTTKDAAEAVPAGDDNNTFNDNGSTEK